MDRSKPLETQLLDRIQALEQQGLIDYHFQMCHSLKEDSGLSFFLELIPMFFADVRTVVNDMTQAMDQPVVDFDAMFKHCIKLTGSSACIGACRIKNACFNLRQAIESKSKDRCLVALNDIKQEYQILQSELDSIIQLERDIVSGRTQSSLLPER